MRRRMKQIIMLTGIHICIEILNVKKKIHENKNRNEE